MLGFGIVLKGQQGGEVKNVEPGAFPAGWSQGAPGDILE